MDPGPEPYPPVSQVCYKHQNMTQYKEKSIQYPPYTTYILPEE